MISPGNDYVALSRTYLTCRHPQSHRSYRQVSASISRQDYSARSGLAGLYIPTKIDLDDSFGTEARDAPKRLCNMFVKERPKRRPAAKRQKTPCLCICENNNTAQPNAAAHPNPNKSQNTSPPRRPTLVQSCLLRSEATCAPVHS